MRQFGIHLTDEVFFLELKNVIKVIISYLLFKEKKFYKKFRFFNK